MERVFNLTAKKSDSPAGKGGRGLFQASRASSHVISFTCRMNRQGSLCGKWGTKPRYESRIARHQLLAAQAQSFRTFLWRREAPVRGGAAGVEGHHREGR